MPKRSAQPYSPFSVLKTAKHPDVRSSKHLDIQLEQEPIAGQAVDLAKSRDPLYTKFTTYVPKQVHRAVKLKALEKNRELSDLVEQLLSDWLKAQ